MLVFAFFLQYTEIMKTLKYLQLLIICLVLVFCAGTLPAQNMGPFSVSEYKETIKASGFNVKFKGAMEISLSLIDTKEAKLAKLINSVLYEGLTSKEYAKAKIDSEKSDYRQELTEYDNVPPWATDWSYDEQHSVTVKGSYAVISKNIFTYYGGAHPNTGVFNFVVNIKKPEHLQLGSIISAANLPKLKTLVVRELKKELASLDVSHDEDFYANDLKIDDYFPDKDGLVFHWNPYAVAYYAAGHVYITVPWKDAEKLLNSKGKALGKTFR